MKDNLNDIEKMFRESFDGFESDVDPSVWTNISNQIGGQPASPDASASSSAGTSGSGLGAGIGAGKLALIVGAAGIISFGAYQLFNEDDSQPVKEDAQVEQIILPSENEAAPASESNEIVLDESEATSDKKSVEIPVESIPKEEVAKNSNSNNTINPTEAIASSRNQSASNKNQSVSSNELKTEQEESSQSVAETKVEKVEKIAVTATTEEVIVNEEESVSTFEASIYASVKEGKQPLEVYFENRGSFARDVRWKFRDGDESSKETARHIFEKAGDYWVILEIRDENGKFSKDSTKITVEGKAYLDIPNTFTPNGDGMNDVYYVKGDYIKTFECIVMDRNQTVYYRWNDINQGWDGKDLNGHQAPKGVYFYIIKAIDMDGNMMKTKTGSITIF